MGICKKKKYDFTNNIPTVVRPTGGRGVYHFNEITYSVSCFNNIFEKELSLVEFYNLIAKALISGLKNIGLKAEINYRKTHRNYFSKSSCYSSISTAEITINGKKLIGSAQRRNKGYILQHGSIPLTLDLETEKKLFNLKDEELKERTYLYQYLSEKDFPINKIVNSLKNGFCECFRGNVVDYNKIQIDKK